ncbi:MAG: protein-L-isoaspartate O-methyltransferase [Spirochaetaceae bacterium]|nr:MAG: protein-L-isoaspartate O-methyltransferase [Spirochaetaceae bacterium]
MMERTKETAEHLGARWDLSRIYIGSNELVGDRVISAFLLAPREHFVRKVNLARAYDDSWLPIGYGATITDPDVVAMMTTSLDLQPHHRVLEIGTGSGYQSAILSRLSNFVYTIEIIEPLARETDELYASLEADYPTYRNIHRKLDDGFYGWEEYAPFDRIIITCAIDHVPPPLIKQLSMDGIIVAPIGPPGRQYIMQIRKVLTADNKVTLTRRDVYDGLSVVFIPFRDERGKSYNGR